MDIEEYCKINNIKCLPVNISVDGPNKKYLTGNAGNFKDGTSNYILTDFAHFSVSECQQISNQYRETQYIAIDTSVVQQLDIDDITGEYNKSPMAEKYSGYPHFMSITKGMPHYFVYTNCATKQTNEIPFPHDILREGMWAWCERSQKVNCAESEIPKIDFASKKVLQESTVSVEVQDLENVITTEKAKRSSKEINAIIEGLPAEAYERNSALAPGEKNYAFAIVCALKKMKAKRQVVKNLMMKAGTGYDNIWFNALWLQDTSAYSFDEEFVLSKSSWYPGCGGEYLIQELPDDILKVTCHDVIWDKFLEWAQKEQLVRVKDSYIILKMKNEYYGEVISKTVRETINLFIESSKFAGQLFNGKNLQAKRSNLECFLKEEQSHKCIPVVEYNWRYFGYKNGLYDITTDTFLTGDFPKNVLSRKYFPVDFNPLGEIPSCLKKIYADQNFYDDTMLLHMALLGRSYYPINNIDDWGVVLVNYGVSNTGKSTTIEIVNRSLNQDKTTTLALSGGGSRFILAGKNNQELLIINEAELLTTVIPAPLFKSMCRGEKVIIEKKGVDEHNDDWNTPMLFASNTEIPYKDKSGGCGNRIVYFKHSIIITPDSSIRTELDALIPQLVPYFCKIYLGRARNPIQLTKQMIEWNNDVAENDDDFKSWINSENEDVYIQVRFARGKSIKPKQLQDAFDKHVKYTLNESKRAIKIGVNEQALLTKIGIIKHRTQHCRDCGSVWKKDCCDDYSQTNRSARIVYLNCELVDGGLNKSGASHNCMSD